MIPYHKNITQETGIHENKPSSLTGHYFFINIYTISKRKMTF